MGVLVHGSVASHVFSFWAHLTEIGYLRKVAI